MSFFGFDEPNSLEDERRKFLQDAAQHEDVAVYTWGEESYDGLGDALQEGGDELNDETFGGGEQVGKDFDFSTQALPTAGVPVSREYPAQRAQPSLHSQSHRSELQASQAGTHSRPAHSLESIWDDRSPFSVLPKANGSSRAVERSVPAPSSTFSPFGAEPPITQVAPHQQPQSIALSLGANHNHGIRTLEEIEAEMREAFAAQRIQNQSPSQLPLHPQGQLRNAAPQRHVGSQYTPTATPPPRMHPHSQSPRFQPQNQHQQHLQLQQQQQQLLELQELRERQQQQQLFELQEQLRMEEIERQRQQQLRAHQQAQLNAQYLQHQRQGSGGTPSGDVQYRRHQATTPSRLQHQQQQQQQQLDAPFQQSLQYLPRDIQMQQRLLAEMAQAEFLHSLQASPVQREGVEEREVQDILRAEAMRKIMEAERMEEKRRRKLEKIRYMSRYNDLMTQSDKDFITRIQVSQLVTQDPYADDFYAQVYGAHIRSRMGFKAPEALLKFGSGGGVGLGLAQVKGGRRQNAMQRMEAQVERLVTNSRLREKEKISLNSLQGALGRTAGRSYKAAPRQLLQVESHPNEGNSPPTLSHAYAHISKADAPQVSLNKAGEGAAREAARFGKEALGSAASSDGLVTRDPLSHREALVLLERLYDTYYDVDHMTESPPPPEEEEARKIWEESIATSVDKLWDGLQVMVPLETSDPHPFISLITPIKGKRMLPRIARFFDTQRMLTLLTLIVACFSQLDIVRNAPLLDLGDDVRERRELEAQTNAFLGGIIQIIEPVVVSAPMRLMSGLLALFLERNDVGIVAKSRPALALLTLFLSRVYTILQELAAGSEPNNPPSAEDIEQWQHVFNHLFQLISPHLLFLFPSVRLAIASNVPLANIPDYDTADQLVWQFLSMIAVHCSVEQQQILIATLRERILENVATATKGWTADEEQRNLRLANVNVLLNALGLDSKDIAI